MSQGKTTADVCAECGHTRYVHPPSDGCDIASNYYVDTCACKGFRESLAASTPEEL